MKKTILLTCLVALALLLSACAGQASATGFGNRSGTPRTLSPEAKLAIGTIKLEGTKQAVNPALAAKLLPLWQVLKQLNSSDSAAPQEVTAVLDQIQSTMAPDQVAAIDAMQISRQDMFAIFQQQAPASGAGGTAGAGSANSSRSGTSGNRGNGGGFFFSGGGAGGGGFGGGGFGGGGFGGGGFNRTGTGGANGTPTTGQNSSATAAQRAQAFASATSNLLINQVIQLLQSKIAS